MINGQNLPRIPSGSVDLGDADLNERIAVGLDRVEELLEVELASGEYFTRDKVSHLSRAGGKRFRPLMTLLTAEFGPHSDNVQVIKAAAVVEMVHLATLYHDDVMDEAEIRRGVESANKRWGNSIAILSGDILLAHASRLMSQLDTDTVEHFAQVFQELVTGQMRETVGPEDGDDPVEHYMKVIEEKTGVLIASAGHLGSRHADADEEYVEALYELGKIIGVIFQIVDDMIDIFSESGESGKTPGTDLREGVFTLPVLLAMQEDSEVAEELRGLLTGPLEDDASVARALELLAASNGRERTMEVIRGYLDRAEEQIARLPDIPATAALRKLSSYTVHRVG